MKKDDIWAIIVFLAAASISYAILNFNKTGGKTADIYVRGDFYESIPLDEDTIYTPAAVPSVKIQVKDGKIGFIESDCPDKVCIHTGFLSTEGQTAVCLPNAVSVVVRGDDDDEGVDTVVR